MAPAVPKDTADPDDTPDLEEPIVDELVEFDAEPREDDGVENGDRIELVRTGIVRVHIGGTRYRLRRPFFGEFKDLRLAVEDVNDEIQAQVDESLRVGRQTTIEQKTHDDDDPDAYIAWRADMRKRSTAASRAMTDLAESRRIEWWNLMWAKLSLDGPLADPPAWVTDAGIANVLLTHWRSAPTGRG